ncbi:MAG: uroporphyrinogen decarboxylase family protein [Syntrophomonadaceae bacterium]|nr:uroporphyrinogen decarboxylase family protein [Syntrophomonadaceae bacterium]
MKRRERVYTTINHQQPDRVPWGEIYLPPALIYRACGRAPVDFKEQLLLKKQFLDRFKLDLLVTELTPENRGWLQKELDFWFNESDVFIFLLVTGGFTRLLNRLQWKEFFLAVAAEPGKMAEMLAEANRRLVDEVEPFLASVSGVIIGDDLAGRHGTLVDPGYLGEVYFPSLLPLVSSIKAGADRPVFFHSDGNIQSLLRAIIDAGFQGVQGLDPAAGMDIGGVKQQYGQQLCLMGNLDLNCLVACSDEELEKEVIRIVSSAAPGGGFIFGTAGGLLEEVDLERLERLSDFIIQYGSCCI